MYIVVVIVVHIYCIVLWDPIVFNCISSLMILLFNSLAFNIISCTDMVWYINCSLWSMFCLVLSCFQCCTSAELNGIWMSEPISHLSLLRYYVLGSINIAYHWPSLGNSRTLLDFVWYLLCLVFVFVLDLFLMLDTNVYLPII